MIRVVIEHKIKSPEYVDKAIELTREKRTEVMKQPGFIAGETLINAKDPTDMLVIHTWENMETWDAWDKRKEKAQMNARINEVLVEPFKARVYENPKKSKKRG